jgi:hypothetical protein
VPLLLLAVLLAPGPADAPPARPAIRTVAGRITEVALAQARVTLELEDGPLVLSVDRNTMVYRDSRFGTLRDLAAGLPARASVGPSGVAHWIELRPKGVLPTRAAESAPEPAARAAATAAAGPPAAPAESAGATAASAPPAAEPPPGDRGRGP